MVYGIYMVWFILDMKIGLGASKRTVFLDKFDCCRFQEKFRNKFLQNENNIKLFLKYYDKI